MTNAERVVEFHRFYGVPAPSVPACLTTDRWQLRLRLIDEEYDEVKRAHDADDIVGVAHELADLLFVVYGAAVECGVPIDDCFRAIAAANLTKVDERGRPFPHAERDKIPKGPNYRPPNVAALLGVE